MLLYTSFMTPGAGPDRAVGVGKPVKLPRVLLASRSERRRQLLQEKGIDYLAEHPGIEDSTLIPGGVDPDWWVISLAYLKARAGLDVFQGISRAGDVVLGADTACVRDGRMLGTPRDGAEAAAIIRALSKGRHDVLTGVALIDIATGTRTLFMDRASVWLGELSDEEISAYVATGQWQGKAGAYNLCERSEAGWPIEYVGDPSTITGLPMKLLIKALERMVHAGAGKSGVAGGVGA